VRGSAVIINRSLLIDLRMKIRTLFCLAVLLVSIIQAGAAENHRPNILLIVSDDQGYPDLGCIGLKDIKTPNLDRLAKEGVRLTNFYVTWPACTPSRGSLLTGRFPQRNGLYDMVRNDMVNYGHKYTWEEYAVSPEMTLGLDVREKTIGDELKRAGYATGMVGKWDMGQARRFLPKQRGFDYFYGIGNNGIDYYTHERYGIASMFRDNERTEADKGTYATDVFKREALRFLRLNKDRPFFLYVAFNAPHGASNFEKEGVQAPAEYVAMYANSKLNDRLKQYYAAVTCMDAAIGELLGALKEQGVEKDTLVVFFSDNGGSGNGGNAPLRGAKSTMWEGGLRVPFVARWPAKIPANSVSEEFLTSLEVFPTFLAAVDAKPAEGVKLDGFDMMPVLQGKSKSPRVEMFWERRGDRAARVGNYKWVESNQGTGLFDLLKDLGEKHDLSTEMPDLLAKVKGRFDSWKREMDASEPRGPFRDY